MVPYLGTRPPHQNDSSPGMKGGIAKSWFALRSESGKEGQIGTGGNMYDVEDLADNFGTLMKLDKPPSLEVLLRPLPTNLRHSLDFEHSVEGILLILSGDHEVHLRGFVLDYLTGLSCLEMNLVELLHKQEALLYFLVTYTALVQDQTGRKHGDHGLHDHGQVLSSTGPVATGAAALDVG